MRINNFSGNPMECDLTTLLCAESGKKKSKEIETSLKQLSWCSKDSFHLSYLSTKSLSAIKYKYKEK